MVETQYHVLAVDDSIIDRKLIERLLETSSFQVTAVDSGSKALEFLGLNGEELKDDAITPSVTSSCNSNDSEVNLIITDYFMPGMTGYDLMRRIKMPERWSPRVLTEASSIVGCEEAPAAVSREKKTWMRRQGRGESDDARKSPFQQVYLFSNIVNNSFF